MKKLRGLSLFANVGVAEALFSDIEVEILIANEIDSKRSQFYSELYPNTNMICGDIIDKEVQKKVVNIKKLNLSDSYYINGKLVKKVHGAKKVDDGLYEMNYIYPTIKQESREYKSKPILLNEH